MSIPIDQWGRDHWSAFAYIEAICVERGYCVPDRRKIQTNHNRHPHLAYYHDKELDGAQYGIRLKGGVTLPGPDYDEWDCLDDMEEAGLMVDVGTGINPAYRMTEKGCDVAAQLRKHKAMGGQYAGFTVKADPEEEPAS